MITVAEPIDADTLRIRHEFLTHQDLRASADTVAEQLGVSHRHAVSILESLVCKGFLGRTLDGQYVRSLAADGAGRR